MHDHRFFVCQHCGNMVGLIHDAGVPLHCCGQPMTALEANTVEASSEKHLPVATVESNTVRVCVGSAEHPMDEDHLIEWVYLQTAHGGQRKALAAGQKPEAVFALVDDKPVAVYAYCNKHGLWKTTL